MNTKMTREEAEAAIKTRKTFYSVKWFSKDGRMQEQTCPSIKTANVIKRAAKMQGGKHVRYEVRPPTHTAEEMEALGYPRQDGGS